MPKVSGVDAPEGLRGTEAFLEPEAFHLLVLLPGRLSFNYFG